MSALCADRGEKRVRARDIFNDAAVYAVSVDLDAERCSALMFLARARIMAAAGKKRRVSDQGCGPDPRLDRLPQGVHRGRRRWHCGRNAGRSVLRVVRIAASTVEVSKYWIFASWRKLVLIMFNPRGIPTMKTTHQQNMRSNLMLAAVLCGATLRSLRRAAAIKSS